MKALYISIALILAVVVFLGINFFITDSFLKKTDVLLSALPENPDELEDFPGTEAILNEVESIWQKGELYCHISLEHDMRRDFYEELITARAYCRENRFDELASSLVLLKDRLEYIRFNESAAFGNIM